MDIGKISELIANYKDGTLDKSALKQNLQQLQIQRLQQQSKRQPLTEGQKGLWAIQKSNTASTAYNVPLCFRVTGLDLSCFTKACHFLTDQYPILKAVFMMDDAVPYQVESAHTSLNLTIEDCSSSSDSDLIAHIRRRVKEPFDLEKGPLFRVSVFQTADRESIVLITIHHIIFDGGSVPVLLETLFDAYEAYLNGREPQLVAVDATYLEYVAREQALIEMNGDASLAYWQEKLAQPLPVLNLPLDKARSSARGETAGHTWSQHIDLTQVERLKTFAGKERAYAWTVLLAVFHILLHRYSGQKDIVVGMPVNQRNEKRFEKVIGLCINMVPVRSQLDSGTSFHHYLKTLQNDVIDGMARSYPFPSLVRKLHLGSDSGVAPVFQTAFAYQDVLDSLSQNERGFVLLDEIHQEGEYEITLEVMNKPDGMLLNWKYDASVFELSTIKRMGEHFSNILDHVLADASVTIRDISLLSPDGKDLLLHGWNSTQADYPQEECIHQLFERKAASKPQEIAVITETGVVSYAELNQQADALAAYLSRNGIRRGDLVAVCVERSLEMLVALLGILKAGGAYVPIDPKTPSERVGHILEDSNVSIVLTHPKTTAYVKDALKQGGKGPTGIHLVDLDERRKQIFNSKQERVVSTSDVDIDSPAYVIYTSGTTGRPKGVCVTHRSILNTLYFLEQEYPVGKEDRYLLKTNYAFDVSISELFGWFVGNGSLVIAPPGVEQSPSRLVDCVRRYGITHINFIPSMLSLFFEAAKELYARGEGRSLKYIMVAGEAFPKELAQKCVSLFEGARVENIYGPTEASIYAAYFSCTNSKQDDKSIPIGRPIANTKLYILDQESNGLAPIGVPGELCIAGVGLAQGYLNKEELTNKVFVENPVVPGERIYRTGDLARWRSDGVIEYMGRLDFQVKVRGFRIELDEIEYHLASHDHVKECAVIVRGQGDAAQLVAYYVPMMTGVKTTQADPHDLKNYLAGKMPSYMVPDFMVELERLPLTPNGKLDRKDLMNRKITLHKKPQQSVDGDVIQTRVLRIWKEVLKIEDLEPTDAFFEVGGNSLLAITLAEKISLEFNQIFDSTDLFTYTNVDAISKYLAETGSVPVTSAEETEAPDAQSDEDPSHPDYYSESAAIIGISCHFPGARDYHEFWNNLMDGKNSVTIFDEHTLQQAGLPRDVLENPNFVPISAGLEGKELFDGEFFKLSPNHVAYMDPQFRQLLMHAWKAVEDAGYYHKDIPNTGVYITAANHNYGALHEDGFRTQEVTEDPEQYLSWVLSQTGSISSMISYQLGFNGQSVSVHSNCSSSLSALDLAFRALMSGQIDYALVAAGAISHIDTKGYVYQQGLNFSSDGRIKTFDASADGMIAGEGVGAILIRRATDAIESNDHIYGLLRGIATNTDGGDASGFYSPSTHGQGRVIQKVIEQTNVSPDTITYVEAHGTGTKLGDPVEFKALTDVYRRYTPRTAYCGIGSLKPNIGHLDTAAGLAGCIKVALALHNKQIPPTINFSTPNPKIKVEQSPFYIVQDAMEWSAAGQPRRAALSSIGLGGTNAHAIFEEYVDVEHRENTYEGATSGNHNELYVLPMSAREQSTLHDYVKAMHAYVQTVASGHDDASASRLLGDIAYTFQTGRAPMKYRVAFVVRNLEELLEGMGHYLNGEQSPLYVTGMRESNGNQALDEQRVSHLMIKDDTSELARAWASGLNLDWAKYYQGNGYQPQRLSLPTYPFKLKEYKWPRRRAQVQMEGPVETAIAAHTDSIPSNDSITDNGSIHPLVHQNVSSFDQIKYRSVFTGREFFLADHIVAGQVLMPAVAVLEMARAAVCNAMAMQCEDGTAPYMKLKNVSWVRPILIPDTGKVVEIELVRANTASTNDDRIKFNIVSVENHESVSHAEGEVIVGSRGHEQASTVDWKTLIAHASKPGIEKEVCYDYIKLAGVNYGEAFQVIDAVHRGNQAGAGYAVAELALPDGLLSAGNQYVLHPSMLDGAIQGMIGLLSDAEVTSMKRGDASLFQTEGTMVPFSMNSIEIYHGCKERMYSLVRDADPAKKTTSSKLLDIDLIDENGVVCVSMRGVRYRKLSGTSTVAETVPQPNSSMPQSSKQHTIIPVWMPVDVATEAVSSSNQAATDVEDALVFDACGTFYDQISAFHHTCRHLLINPDDTIESLQRKIEAQQVGHMIWVAPAPVASDTQTYGKGLIEEQESGMLHLFRLMKATLRAGYGVKKLRWTIITRSTQKIKATDRVNPAHAGVHGLIGSMAKEYAHWDVRLVDIPSDTPVMLDKIFSLPRSTQGKTLGLRNGEWFTQQLETIDTLTMRTTTPVYRRRGVYVIIGGAGGVGELWTRYMIEQHQASVVWIGRRPVDQRIKEQLQTLSALARTHGANAPTYLSADACDQTELTHAYEKIKEIYPSINGVVHSAIVLADKSLANMDEARFRSATSVKVDASVNMVEVFSREKLDFLLFFSSIETFVREAGQANYAAGCTFIDSFAQAMGTDAGTAGGKPLVKTMNWGYWGTVGIVSDSFYQDRMTALGVGSLDANESMAQLERFMSSPYSQIALVHTLKDTALARLGISGNSRQLDVTIPNVLEGHDVWRNVGGNTEQIHTLSELLPAQSMHDLTLHLVCAILKEMSGNSRAGDTRLDLAYLYQLLPSKLHRWLDECKRQLLENGFAKQGSGGHLILDANLELSTNKLWNRWNTEKHEWVRTKQLTSQVRLVEACLTDLQDVLLGKKKATDIIFPNSSMEALDGIYKGSPIVDYYNKELSKVVCNVIKARLTDDPNARIRILEVGAGTGGTTATVLPDLKPYADSIDEYCYTDISKAFLIHAEDTFADGNPYLKTSILNIEEKPTAQGFVEGYYDVVISTNALHATSDIRNTMRNIKSVMKTNGVVVLNEMCSNTILAHVTFGLLDGWWLYRDAEIRIPGSPGLTGEAWIDILTELGYMYATLPDPQSKGLGQQVIVAASNGVISDSAAHVPLFVPAEEKAEEAGAERFIQAAPVSASRTVAPVAVPASNVSNVSSNRSKVKLTESAHTYLKKIISEALKVPESELEVDRNLDEYGLDSILVVKINNALAEWFDGLDSSLLFEQKCISALVDYLLSERPAELQAMAGISEISTDATVAEAAVITEVATMTEDTIVAKEQIVSESELRKACANYLKVIIGKALKVDTAELDDDRSLFEYGLDSILVIKINNALSSDFNEIDSNLVFDNPTVSELVEYFVSTRRSESIEALGIASSAPVTAGSTSGDKPAGSHSILAESVTQPDIAIVGLNVRMPGAATMHEFWENIANGKNGITPFPADRWWYDDTPIENRHGGFLEEVGCFDAPFFGITDQDAKMMDPQERVFIESVYGAIQDAGYTPQNLAETRKIGVFVGVMNATYNQRAAYSSIANRTSYLFDFQGTSLAVDTACSSALTAIHLAMESIRRGENECAIAGGVNLLLNLEHFKLLSDLNMTTSGQACKPFSEHADGFLASEGVGAVVLRPLDQALKNGDHIYGIIKGSAVNANGRSNKYNVPNSKAQVEVITEALKNAKIDPSAVSYIEAHGTGTTLGDSIEVSALKRAFQSGSDHSARCAIGSVKSNIGHSESASGMASLAKVLMQIKHRKLAPSINCEELNSGIVFTNSPFYVQRELSDWLPAVQKEGETARIAGISSFGAGGSNAHLIVKEYQTKSDSLSVSRMNQTATPVLIPLSARSVDRLGAVVRELADYLPACDYSLEDIAYTLQVGREQLEARILFVASTVEELVTKLRATLTNGLSDAVMISQVDQLAREYARDGAAQAMARTAMESGDDAWITSHWLGGYPVPWEMLYRSVRPRRVSLPTYPFQKIFYWETEPPKGTTIRKSEAFIEMKPPASQQNSDDPAGHVRLAEAPLNPIMQDNAGPKDERNPNDVIQQFLVDAIQEQTSVTVQPSQYDTSFMDLGLPSKAIIRMTQLIRKHIDPLFESAVMFECTTIHELTAYLSERCPDPDGILQLAATADVDTLHEQLHEQKQQPASQAQMTEQAVYPLSASQQGIWALQKAFPESSSYHVPMCFRVSRLNREALHKAYQYTLTQHPVLHAVVREMNGKLAMVEYAGITPIITEANLTHLNHADALEYLRQEARQPFHLEEGPLCRLSVYHTSEHEALVLLNVHHIVFDGQSAIVLMKTLFSAYEAVAGGGALPSLLPLACYRDFVKKEQQLVASEEGANRLQYWREQLHDAPVPLELYTDHPRTDTYLDAKGATYTHSLSGEVNRGIAQVARSLNVYPSTVFMAMLHVLLHVYSQQRDIVVGMPVNGREEQMDEHVIGNFVNMVPVRARIDDQERLDAFCKNLQRTVIRAVSNSYPFPLLVRELGIPTDAGGAPLFSIAYMYQDWIDAESTESKTFTYVEGIHQEGEYELVLEVLEPSRQDQSYTLNWKYNADLYDAESISRLNGHYLNLIHSLIECPDQRMDAVSVMSAAEAELVLHTWNDTATDYPREKGVHELFISKAQEVPEATALIYGNTEVTYAELNDRSDALAAGLQRLGVGPNQFVAIYMDRSIELVVGLLGILKAGAAYIPLDPEYPEERVIHILSDSGAGIILTRSSLVANLQSVIGNLDSDSASVKPAVIEIDEYAAQNNNQAANMPKPMVSSSVVTSDTLAYAIYTSGSTGKPKGVMIHHQALTNFLCSMAKNPGLCADDTMLAVTTHCFDIAALELFLPLIQGATCHICDSATTKNGDALKALIEKVRPTIMQATPSTWSMLFHCGWRNAEKLKILCGGEAMSESLRKQICDTGSLAWNMYGPTETTVWSTVNRVSAEGPITIGRPIANTQIYILNDQGYPNPAGVPGELCIAGDGVSKGYVNRPDLNAEKFIDHPMVPNGNIYRTGDLARWKADGTIEYLGRIDSQVKIRGHRIELGEIEAQLMRHPAIAQCVVVDKVLGEEKQLVAYFIRQSSAAASTHADAADLRIHLAKTLPGYMVPAHFIELDQLPQTPNGKIDRGTLKRRPITRRPASDSQPAQADRHDEKSVLAIWQEVLGVHDLRADEGFFEVGGSSVSAAIVANKISQAFHVPFSVTDMFKYPKAQDIAAYLRQAGNRAEDRAAWVRDGVDKPVQKELNQHDSLPEYYKSSVAIIGMSCQVPGAENHRQFWDNLVNGVESVRFYSPDELKEMNVDPDIINHERFVPVQSTIEGKGEFDADFFKVSAKDAEVFDPQLRLLLGNSWKAIEDAGYMPSDVSDAAVYMSTSNSHYQSVLTRDHDQKDSEALVNFLLSQMGTIPTMISYKLGLKGPSLFIHTNCSSSLAGLSVAFNAIQSKQCTHALVGGAAVYAASGVGYLYEEGLSLSSDGHCKPFDASADGMIGGEGVVVLLLKDAEAAVRDNDNIYAIIRGIGMNNDGNDKTGFYAPSVSGQSDVITQVLESTQIHPETISYVEAHGTGTKLGDPVELSALTDAYRKYTNQNQYCAIGSVKSNIGHLDSAAGLAGCMKAALVLRNGVVPPSIHYRQPNPNIPFEKSPFYVADRVIPLEQHTQPLRAALSSFGIGGTNVHAILEAPLPQHMRARKNRDFETSFIVPLSAQKPENLKQYAADLRSFLLSPVGTEIGLDSIAYTLQTGRVAMQYRTVLVVQDATELIEALQSFIEGKQDHRCFTGEADNSNGVSSLISDEEEQAFLLNRWMQTGNVAKIAKWWATGGHVQWSLLYGQQRPARVSVPTYPFSKQYYWITDDQNKPEKRVSHVSSAHPAQSVLSVPSASDGYSVMTFEESWEPSPIEVLHTDECKTVICFWNEPASRDVFADYLMEHAPALEVIYVGKGDAFQKISDTYYLADSDDPDALLHLFDTLNKNLTDVCSVVYMWPVGENRALADVSYVIGMIQSIARSSLLVSDIIVAGTYGDSVERASLDSLIGIERSIKQVLLDTTVRVLMSRDSADAGYWAQIVSQELYSSQRTSALYIDGVRHTHVVRPITIDRDPGTASVLRTNGTYVVTGGSGGLGKKLTEWLVTSHDARVILIGRSDVDVTSAEWIKRLGDKSDRITYWRADVTDVEALRARYEADQKQNPPVHGVFHLAGVAEKALLTDKSLGDADKVLSPKTYGTLAIEQVFGAESLDFICHFSSIASILGDFGSCDYAVANRFQSSLARARRAEGTQPPYHVYAISWPLLEDGGLGALARKGKDKQSLEMYLASSAQKPLDFTNMTRLLSGVLQSECANPVVLYVKEGKAEHVLGEYLAATSRLNQVALGHVIPSDVATSDVMRSQVTASDVIPSHVTPSTTAQADNLTAAALTDRSIRIMVTSIVKEIVQSVLHVKEEKLELTKSFSDIGFDSIRLAQFARELTNRFGVKILPSVFFDYTTLSELLGYLLDKHYSQIAALLQQESQRELQQAPQPESQQEMQQEPSQQANASQHSDQPATEDDLIAIIGMSGLFPEADSVEQFWQNLVDGRDSVKEIPPSRFDVNAYYSKEATPTTTDCKWMGYIDQVAEFDPPFFEISPREARTMDPRQRHLLQESWKALEDAGVGPDELARSTVGVFVGVEQGDYHLVSEGGAITSNNDAILASRLSYFLNLSGPVLAMNTACSSGLVAIHQACASLRQGECDIAIVSAANFILSPESFVAMSQAGMLSKTGKCRTFDESADGMVPGEAVTVLVLKRMSQAERDGNSIYSLIVGSGINYDGKTNGITAPSGHAQQALISSIHQKYNIHPADIGHIVTHGTGTRLGDPVEVNALASAFGEAGAGEQAKWCALTSTKTNIGHTFAASGLVSLIALSESIRHGLIPPSLHCEHDSDYINWDDSPFYVNKALKKWPYSGNRTRMGAVSAFGMSGTNAHVVIREYVPKTYVAPTPAPGYLLVLSAKTQEALHKRIASMIEMFEREDISPAMLARISDTLITGQHHFRHRCAIVVTSAREALDLWRGVLNGALVGRTYSGLVGRDFTAEPLVTQEVASKSRQLIEAGIGPEAYLQCLTDLAQRYSEGYDLSWQKQDKQAVAKGIALPPYPFAAKRYWFDENQDGEPVNTASKPDSLPAESGAKVDVVQTSEIVQGRTNQYVTKFQSEHSEQEAKKEGKISLVPLDRFTNVTHVPATHANRATPIALSTLTPAASEPTFTESSMPHHTETNERVLKEHDVLEDLKIAADIGFNGMIPTLNRTGVMCEYLIPYSSDFAEYAGICGGEVLDLGCAYGVATIAALEKGARVFAMDLEQKHLDILEQRIDEKFRERLSLKQGKLPDVDFEDGRFNAIHASRVIHFLSPEEVRLTLSKMYRWLKPGGKIFLSTDSPYFGYWQSKAPEYEERKRKGDPWPCFIENVYEHFDPADVVGGPSLINALDPEVFERECLAAGFMVEKCGFFSSVGVDRRAQHAPEEGMEHVGIIAQKPVLIDPQGPGFNSRHTVLSHDGVPISYEVTGSGSEWLVLVHGLGCNSSFWAKQVEYFSNKYRVVNIELAGHGNSGGNREKWTIEAYAHDVASVINQLGLTSVVLVGHSLGGPVIVEAQHHIRSRVIGLIGVDTLHNVAPKPMTDEQLEMYLDSYFNGGAETKDMFLPDADPALIRLVDSVRESVGQEVLQESFREMVIHMPSVSGKLHAPLTLINSSSWVPTNLHVAKRYGIHVESIENVGHFSMLEAPGMLNHLIEKAIATYMSSVTQ
ncbi:non-ribosomal peptide synthetase [Brevibacillus dissolubilis]|uniref:non-ribosomal peptide synthetase n=1 Tax=Brevibacillus dissolubilis TaxID=1844116 RepID=UPI0011177A20|nr:non-ribosomal peptide synthetase [Brevibacillus dissolubilis]